MFPQECTYLAKCILNGWIFHSWAIKWMPPIWVCNKFVLNSSSFQCFSHHDWLYKRYIFIFLTMEQKCWRICRSNIAKWFVWSKPGLIFIRIMATYFSWPDSLLPTVKYSAKISCRISIDSWKLIFSCWLGLVIRIAIYWSDYLHCIPHMRYLSVSVSVSVGVRFIKPKKLTTRTQVSYW